MKIYVEMKSIKFSQSYTWILFVLILCNGCQSGKKLNTSTHSVFIPQDKIELSNSANVSSVINSDSLAPGMMYPIQRDTSVYHNFGDIRIKKNDLPRTAGGLGEYMSLQSLKGYKYYEHFPFILSKLNSTTNLIEELIYYDSSRTNVEMKINIRDANPYSGKYQNLINAYPSFEYYDKPPDSLKQYYRSADPDGYLTYYEGGDVKLNGYSSTEFYLVAIKDGFIQSWETTIVVHNPKGERVGMIREPNVVGISTISDDGSLIAYKYGNYPENPYDDSPDGEVRIRDIHTNNLIFQYRPEEGYKVGMERYYDLGCFIGIGHERKNVSNQDTVYLDLIDLNGRIQYRKDFTWEEFYKAKREINCTSCFILHYPFEKSKI